MRSELVDFSVEHIKPVTLEAAPQFADRAWMSPYVWWENAGSTMLVRAAPRDYPAAGQTGTIFCGRSEDGISFKLDDRPVLSPGPDKLDIGGCEDPTVVK